MDGFTATPEEFTAQPARIPGTSQNPGTEHGEDKHVKETGSD